MSTTKLPETSQDFDFTGITFKFDTFLGFIPRYTLHIPHSVVLQFGTVKDLAGACKTLAAYVIATFGWAGGPFGAVAASGTFLYLAVWLTAQMYVITYMDNGEGVDLKTLLSPAQPYWIVFTA